MGRRGCQCQLEALEAEEEGEKQTREKAEDKHVMLEDGNGC